MVCTEQALVAEQEVVTLVSKEATERVPPLKRVSGFYIWYFVVPWKDGGLRLLLGLCRPNHSVKTFTFKLLTLKQGVTKIRSENLFITIEDAYVYVSILPQHRKFLKFVFGGKALQYLGSSFRPSTVTQHFHQCMD